MHVTPYAILTDLERNHPWYHAFLLWHRHRCLDLYGGNPELETAAKNWVCRNLVGGRG